MALATVVGVVLFAAVLLRVLKEIVQTHRSPLSKLPSAGWGARYSRLLWAFRHEYRGTITLDLPKLHRQQGPLIQIGPNEVSFYSIGVYDIVHKVNSGFAKDPRNYGTFVQEGHPALFSITHPEEHSKRRRIMGQLFSRSKMPNLESLMLHHVNEFVAAISRKSGALELVAACRALEADIIAEFSFGKPLNAIASWEKNDFLAIVAKNDEKATWMPLITSFPTLHETWSVLRDLASRATSSNVSYNQGLQQFDQWTLGAWKEAIDTGSETKTPYPNLIKVLLASGLHPETALSEAKENLGPGTDTTSGSLAHIIFALAQNEVYQQKLHDSLLDTGFSTDMSILENVPLLRACVKEGIRWAGTAAAMLPRIAPSGGVELHGKFIPEGTVLTSSPIWYLRDENAYPEPEQFDPYRWVDESGTTLKEDVLRDKFYLPFSKGANVCMGVHFSYYELYLSVSQLVKAFHIQSASQPHGSPMSGRTHHDWNLVSLPKRKEWVAAVLTESILVKMVPRSAS